MQTESLSSSLSSSLLEPEDLEDFIPRDDVEGDWDTLLHVVVPDDVITIRSGEHIVALCGTMNTPWGIEAFVIPSILLVKPQYMSFFKICKKMVDAAVSVHGAVYAHCKVNTHEKWLRCLGFDHEADLVMGDSVTCRFKRGSHGH